MLLHVAAVAVLTLTVNAPSMSPLLRKLGMTSTSKEQEVAYADLCARVSDYAWKEYARMLASSGSACPESKVWLEELANWVHIMQHTKEDHHDKVLQEHHHSNATPHLTHHALHSHGHSGCFLRHTNVTHAAPAEAATTGAGGQHPRASARNSCHRQSGRADRRASRTSRTLSLAIEPSVMESMDHAPAHESIDELRRSVYGDEPPQPSAPAASWCLTRS